MTIKFALKILTVLSCNVLLAISHAASLSFDSYGYQPNQDGQIVVTINYDFIDTPTFGGGFNVIYDPTVLEFVSYRLTPGPLQDASLPGSLDSPGNYLNASVGTFDFFSGINTAGSVGTFVFNVMGVSGDAGCGTILCLTPVVFNPVISLLGQDITDDVFANGISAANLVPIPAAVWFLLSGLSVLFGFNLKSK